jgi:tetratricopeptide (TPR) repeat protein
MTCEPAQKSANPVPQSPQPLSHPSQPGRPSGWRKWLFRILSATLVPILLLGFLEVGLRLGGYGYPTALFLPGPAGTRVENRDYGRRFFPLSLPHPPPPLPCTLSVPKRVGTCRIFVLGESAAMGFPEPSVGFARVLEVLLQVRYPQTRFEVVNTAMVAINSNTVLPIARECAGYEPDLFVVLLGNNEVVGPFGAAGVLGPQATNLALLRANLAVKTTRTGQMLNRLVYSWGARKNDPRKWTGMTTFAESHVRPEDPRLPVLYGHFRSNLEDVCSAGAGAGVPVLVCTVPVNLKDSAPFGSSHGPGVGEKDREAWEQLCKDGAAQEEAGDPTAALRSYEAASAIDDGVADLEFRLGRCHLALGQREEALRHYSRARDLDTLRFRADTSINDIVREVCAARASAGVRLVDAERVFAESSPAGVPGEEFFLEHVHMNFKGNALLAQTVFEAVQERLPDSVRTRDSGKLLSEEECAERLACTEWNELKIATQIRGMFERPPFTNQLDRAERDRRWDKQCQEMTSRLRKDGFRQALGQYQQALQWRERDWMVRLNYGQLLMECGRAEEAAEQYQAALDEMPRCFPARCKLGELALKAGKFREAAASFRAALEMAPDYAEADYGLARALAGQGKLKEALAICSERMKDPDERPAALILMGILLSRSGRLEEARARFTEALPLHPEDPMIHVHLGDVAVKEGRREAAITEYEAALRLRPDWPELTAYVSKLRKAVETGEPRRPQGGAALGDERVMP